MLSCKCESSITPKCFLPKVLLQRDNVIYIVLYRWTNYTQWATLGYWLKLLVRYWGHVLCGLEALRRIKPNIPFNYWLYFWHLIYLPSKNYTIDMPVYFIYLIKAHLRQYRGSIIIFLGLTSKDLFSNSTHIKLEASHVSLMPQISVDNFLIFWFIPPLPSHLQSLWVIWAGQAISAPFHLSDTFLPLSQQPALFGPR